MPSHELAKSLRQKEASKGHILQVLYIDMRHLGEEYFQRLACRRDVVNACMQRVYADFVVRFISQMDHVVMRNAIEQYCRIHGGLPGFRVDGDLRSARRLVSAARSADGTPTFRQCAYRFPMKPWLQAKAHCKRADSADR